MKIRIWLCFIMITWTMAAQTTPIAMLHNSCGSGYFIDNESNQPAMLVRGFFCGNSYIYTPVGIGDSIKELAYLDHALYSGVAEDYDSSGHVIGRYRFHDGLLVDLEEFLPNGTPILQLHFEQGKQHGEQRRYNGNGKLEQMNTYNMGALHGPFYYAWYGDFDQCLVKGYAIFGEFYHFKGYEPCRD